MNWSDVERIKANAEHLGKAQIEILCDALLAARLVIECAVTETEAERAPEGAMPKDTVVWDCAQHRRAAVDAYAADERRVKP